MRTYAAERLDVAQSELSQAEQSLRDTASAVYSLTDEVKATARELKDTSAALRDLDPAALIAALARARRERLALIAISVFILVTSGPVLVRQ